MAGRCDISRGRSASLCNKGHISDSFTRFEAMFGTSFKERYNEDIPLPGKMFEDVNAFLHCIYPRSQKKTDEKNVYEVLSLADEYDVKYLIKECNRFLKDRPPTPEVVLCHELATRHKSQSLREVCATRLSHVGLKDIESASQGDTDTFLQIYKDVLSKKGETLEDTRTELVNLHLNNNIPDISSTVNISQTRGSIIKLKLNMDSLHENERILSSPETQWDIAFKVEIFITEEKNVRYLAFYLSADFPENNEHDICSISAKCIVKLSCRENDKCMRRMMKDRKYSKEASPWGYRKLVKIGHMTEGDFDDYETLDIVVYMLSTKVIC